MIIACIVVTDLNNAIGKNNKLLCHLPADLKFFKTTTMGCPIIMGRKTFESIGRALPGRKNIVITRNKDFKFEGVEIYHSVEDCMKNLKEEKVFVIGGAEIYKQTLPFTNEIYRTLVKHKFEADTFFPEINPEQFDLVWEEQHVIDDASTTSTGSGQDSSAQGNNFDYTFQKFVRRK